MIVAMTGKLKSLPCQVHLPAGEFSSSAVVCPVEGGGRVYHHQGVSRFGHHSWGLVKQQVWSLTNFSLFQFFFTIQVRYIFRRIFMAETTDLLWRPVNIKFAFDFLPFQTWELIKLCQWGNLDQKLCLMVGVVSPGIGHVVEDVVSGKPVPLGNC